jgi:hypothetical protein
MAIRAELRLGIRDFKANLDRATQEVRKSAGAMKRDTGGIGTELVKEFKGLLPAMGLGAIGAGIKSALNRADELADLKVALGETAETLQRVDFAAQQAAGIGVEDLAKAVIRLEKGLGDVENKKAADALESLGLSAEELAALPLDEKLIALSEAFQKSRATGTGVADIMDLLGKSAAELLPLLGQTEEALRELFENAPVTSEEMIDSMAELNDRFDGLIAKAKNFGITVVGGLAGWTELIGDIASEGSLEDGFAKFEQRDADRARKTQEAGERQKQQAEAIAAAQAAAKAEADEKKKAEDAAEAKDRAGADIGRLKEQMEADRIDVLPDDQKIAALEAKLKEKLGSTVGMFSLNFDTSIEGLEKLARSREGDGRLPAEGQNSAKEAYEWLVAAKEIEEQIAAIKAKVADEEEAEREKAAKAAEKRREELEDARKKAEEGGFALMTPEQQAAKLRQDLEGALGIEVKSAADIDAGLNKARGRVEAARAAGDVEAEKAALDALNESQAAAKEFMDAAAGLAPDAPSGGVGSLAGLVNQMMGRDPQAMALEEAQRGNKIADEQRKALDKILKKMDNQPPDVRFGRGF